MKRRWLTLTIIACVLGISCSVLSIHNYIRIHQGSGVFKESFCAVSSRVNCDVVEASSYASINGFPIAGFGLAYYILILMFSLYAKFSRGFKKPTVAFAWWSTILALFYSIALAYVSAFVLRTLCLTCLGMYIANILLFISLYFAMGLHVKEVFSFGWGYWVNFFTGKKEGIDFKTQFGIHFFASVIVFIITFLAVMAVMKNVKALSSTEIEQYVNRFYNESKVQVNFNKENTPLWGNKNAPVTIVEYSDFRCPVCRKSAFAIKPFLAEFKDSVQYYFINFPLDSSCNHYMQHQMHPGACLGAKAAICADKQGKFWEFHDEIFRTTGKINLNLINSISDSIKLNEPELIKCINSVSTERKLKQDIEASRSIFITHTPTIIVNGRRLAFWQNPDILRSIVKKEIKSSQMSK